MITRDSSLFEHIQVLHELQTKCLHARDLLEIGRQQKGELAEQRDVFLNQVRTQCDEEFRSLIEKIELEARTRLEQSQIDVGVQRDAATRLKDQKLQELDSQLQQQVSELRQKLQNELWVLQSVCDEQNEDTPVRHAERAQEIQNTQQSALEQQLSDLHQRIEVVSKYLKDCHAGTDSRLPTATIELKGRESTRKAAVAEIDSALVAASEIESQGLPQWIAGWRLYGLGLVVFLVVSIVSTALGTELPPFINPEFKQPDWSWLGVSGLIGFATAFLIVLSLVLTVRSRLRHRFESVLLHSANASAAYEFWVQKSQKDLKHLVTSAEKWKVEMLERREQHAHKLQTACDSEVEQLTRTHSQMVSRVNALFDEQTEAARTEISRQQFAIENWQAREMGRLDAMLRADFQRQKEAYDKQLTRRLKAMSERDIEALDTLKCAQDQVAALMREGRTAAESVVDWDTMNHQGWKVPMTLPAHVPVGVLQTSMPAAPDSADDDLDLDLYLEVPALLNFPRDMSIAVEHEADGAEPALKFVRALMLRLLTHIMPGRIQFTLIDPVGLGQSFSAMMHLADFDELLIGSRIWTDASQIRDRLQNVTEHMERIFQTYLRSEFQSIEDYNAAAGEVAEPYHFVVIAGFPAAFTEEAARYLTSILTNGPRCGVHTLIAWSPDQNMPRSFDVAHLRHNCTQFHIHDDRVVPGARFVPMSLSHSSSGKPFDIDEIERSVAPAEDPDHDPVTFLPLTEPAAPQYVQLVRSVGERSRDARRVEVSFSRIAPTTARIWTLSSAEEIDFPIGRAGASRLQHMRLGKGTSQHVLIAGKTGSGKSTLLHILITNLALHYSPDEIQFYLIDFKKGVEFRTYAANKLPHARVVAIESDREFGLSVLERLDEILQERGELFRVRGVQDVPSFRRQFPDERMPRLLLLIDEFQEFFTSEDRVSSRASLLLDRLIRQGRAFGIHVLLGSQTLGGAYSLARSTMGQVAVRIALQCSESDAHLILSEDNPAARLLARPGEAIYNDANGLVDGNHPFQIAWLDENKREAMIRAMVARPDYLEKAEGRMIVFEGNVAPDLEHCGPLHGWLSSEPDASRHFVDSLPAWIGEPVAIAAPVNIEFRRTGGQNVLIVGQDSDLADSIFASIVVSWTTIPSTSTRPRTSRMILLQDGSDKASRDRFTSTFTPEIAPRLLLKSATEADAVVAGLWQQMTEREAGNAPPDSSEIILAIRNIGQFRTLRREDDEFGMGSFGAPKVATPATQLGELIRRGPAVGIHVIIWSDTFNNAMRWLSNSLLREFDSRIAFRLNQTDSSSLMDTPAASSLTQGRAILYRDQTGTADRFRPFNWPSQAWLQNLCDSHAPPEVQNLDDLPLMNIDELFIE